LFPGIGIGAFLPTPSPPLSRVVKLSTVARDTFWFFFLANETYSPPPRFYACSSVPLPATALPLLVFPKEPRTTSEQNQVSVSCRRVPRSQRCQVRPGATNFPQVVPLTFFFLTLPWSPPLPSARMAPRALCSLLAFEFLLLRLPLPRWLSVCTFVFLFFPFPV